MRFFRKEGKPTLTSVEVRGTNVTVGKKYRFGLPGDDSSEQEGFFIEGRVMGVNEWRSRMNPTDVRHNVTLARLGRKETFPASSARKCERGRSHSSRPTSPVKRIRLFEG